MKQEARRQQMRRFDTTPEARQVAYPGEHLTRTGTWSYAGGAESVGTRLLRCNCGFRIVGIATQAEHEQARADLVRHQEEMAAERVKLAAELAAGTSSEPLADLTQWSAQ